MDLTGDFLFSIHFVALFDSKNWTSSRHTLNTNVMQIVQLRKGATFVESCKAPRANEFDLGGSANCSAVFGSGACRCLLHLLPLPRAAAGDGLSFASRPPARRV